jgi:hypothetical protein
MTSQNSTQGSTTVMMLLDAFRWDYIDESATPNLWRLAQEGTWVRKLQPSAGFCERSDIFTGASPVASGNFTAMTYDRVNSAYRNQRSALAVFGAIEYALAHTVPSQKIVRKLARLYFNRVAGISQPVYDIPFDQLGNFALTEDLRPFWEPRAGAVESIFDVMSKRGKTFFWQSFTSLGYANGGDDDRCRVLAKNLARGHDLHLLYLGQADMVPHKHGTRSTERDAAIGRIDRQVQELVESFQATYQEVNFLIIGDHGMMDVEIYLDLRGRLARLAKERNVRVGEHLIAFFDSTMARFWCTTDAARRVVADLMSDPEVMQNGQTLTDEDAARLRVPAAGPRYGEVIWWARPGVIIFPDYFHRRERYRAMHGYDPGIEQQQGMAIVHSPMAPPSIIEQGALIDSCPTLCQLLGIEAPAANEGKSLVRPADG